MRFWSVPLVLLALLLSFSVRAAAQTEGTLTFTVTTQNVSGPYAPRHVIATWVSDSSNRFVKTLERRGERRQQYLYTWQRISDGNVADAVTGATIGSQPDTRSVTWDGRDTAGNVVPDGGYRIRVEFTSEHAQGPITPEDYLEFTKGPEEDSGSPPDLRYFTDMSFTYRPDLETNTFVAAESIWKYHDQGVDLHGSNWNDLGYDDSGWEEGPGKLGYSDSPATTLDYGGDPDDKHPCYYFRHSFTAPFVPTSLKLRVLRDDGVVVYLNGTEVARSNMDDGVQYDDLASATVGGADEDTYFVFYIDPTTVRAGTNVIAAQVHQADVDSSDLGFDLELKAGPPASVPSFLRGDTFPDGKIDVTDALAVLNYLFLDAARPGCFTTADANDDSKVDVSDAVALLLSLFVTGDPLPEPSGACGEDPTADELDCAEYSACAG